MSYWYDREGKSIDLRTWGTHFQDEDYKRVAVHYARGWMVSTVWMGVDHSFGDGPPLIFETMIFPPGDEAQGQSTWSGDYCERYATEAAAHAGHDQALAWLAEKLGDDTLADLAGPLVEGSSDTDWDGTI